MADDIQQERIWAVQRFLVGEKPESICASLGRSKAWLYKWVERHIANDSSWSESWSRRPLTVSSRIPKEVEEIVKMVRLNLYNRDLFCGAQAIRWELEDLGVKPLPSLRTINRILTRNELTNRRTGKYESKGTAYPKLPSLWPNQTHQADLIGPCYLKGPMRFYGLNVVDTATVRCGLHSCRSPRLDRTSWTVSGPSGSDWECQRTSRWTMPCPSLAVRRIPEAWGRSFGSVSIMALNRGSFPWLNRGETE